MPLWSRTTPPKIALLGNGKMGAAVPGVAGWEHPETKELLVAMAVPPTISGTGATVTVVNVVGRTKNFRTGDKFTLEAVFNKEVDVVGVPQMTVTVNGVTMHGSYVSGSGTATLRFAYTVVGTDFASASQIAVTSPLTLNGGSIKNHGTSTNVTLTFTPPSTALLTMNPSVAGVAQKVVSVVLDKSVYITDDVLAATVQYDGQVTVTGTPRIALTINGTTRQALYASGSGTGKLTFNYTIVAGDAATAGQFTVAGTINLNSGTIKNTSDATLAAGLTYTAPSTATVTVN
jgi:hypothetical protein